MNLELIYEEIIKGKVIAYFYGKNDIKDYLCYVLGNNIQMKLISHFDEIKCRNSICIYDDITGNTDNLYAELNDDKATYIRLSDFVLQFNDVHIPTERPVALWGGGTELKSLFNIISKYCQPTVIIDKQKEGEFEGVPFVKPESINIEDYFIVITTTRYASEIKEILDCLGKKIGVDYIHGADPKFLNDNAEMFVKTITDIPLKRNSCKKPFEYVNIGVAGNLTHCCYEWLPKYIGNVFDTENMADTITSRIIRVSFMNQTYSFCNSVCCPYMSSNREDILLKNHVMNDDLYLKEQEIVDVDVAFDNTCNLRCESCRSEYIIDKSIETINIAEKICKKMIPESRRVTVAGNGEVFLSKAYSKIFEGFYPNTDLTILSNGNLFTFDKWKQIENHFKEVTMMFSIDAATKETYELVRRGGKWENLVNGLKVASELREKNQIRRFIIRFVVSKRNYLEMPEFVRLGIDYGCDIVDFSRLENWGTFSDEEFNEMSMFIGDSPKLELKSILDLPIMGEKIVRYTNIIR